ncbi:MAG: hypothetical protein K0S14_3017, partial [Thermomicrobiales bacterium]|nr:hypothetical protein [Thermomicrobiales bacterium]
MSERVVEVAEAAQAQPPRTQ